VTKEVSLESVLTASNLSEAFRAVKRNKGSAGIDGRDIDATHQHLQLHWHQIKAKLQAGSYSPSPVKGIYIPKASGGNRLLGIPTVQDRLIQQAVQQQLSQQFDPLFSEHSYGFRPQRSAHDAVKAAQRYVQKGKAWVIDIDLKAFFDNVNHDKLIFLIREQVKDKGLLRLVRKILSAGIVIEGQWQASRRGTPQGSPLSPLLANIYLDPLDKELEQRGLSFCRYADDINIYVASESSAQRVYASIVKWIEKHLKLSVNTNKSGTGRPWDRQFLGYSITQEGKLSIDEKRLERHKDKVRQLWRANQSLTSPQLVEQWRSYLIGWCNYFSLTEMRWQLRMIGGWTRRHMRKCFWLRWHNRKGRYNALKRLGANARQLMLASSSRGAWRIASSPTMHVVLSNKRLKRYGLLVADDLLGA
jgi:group II intron reverse transcriptase/maturase